MSIITLAVRWRFLAECSALSNYNTGARGFAASHLPSVSGRCLLRRRKEACVGERHARKEVGRRWRSPGSPGSSACARSAQFKVRTTLMVESTSALSM